jgi:hypothetical protein
MGLSLMNMLGLSSSVNFALIACYWKILAFALYTSYKSSQYRLCRADYAYLTYRGILFLGNQNIPQQLFNFIWFPMKIDMDEAYVYRSRTIIPLNEVDCSRDVETRPPNALLTQCRVTACAAKMYSAESHCILCYKAAYHLNGRKRDHCQF